MSTNPKEERVKAIVEQGRQLKGDAHRLQIRKTAQQTLLFLSDTISRYNQRMPPLSAPGPALGLFVAGRSGYRNIIPVLKGGKKDAVSPIVSLGADVTKFFTFDLTSAQQAMLYPKIRLFKVEYQLDPKTGQVILPFVEKDKKEIVFDKAVTSKELSILRDRGGNLGSAGIESFDWALKGVNPAEIDSNIEASLKIYFNNIGVFAERIRDMRTPTLVGHLNAITSPTPGSSVARLKTAHFMDLITFAPPTTTRAALPCQELYEPEFFEVLAEVGWEVADGAAKVFSEQQISYIEKQTVKLYLTLSEHKFDFKEDGTATLTANYRARHTMSDAKHDILNPTREITIAAANVQAAKDAAAGTSSTTTATEKIVEEEENLNDLLKKNYRNIIDSLLKNMYRAEVPTELTLNTVFTTLKKGKAKTKSTLTFPQLMELLQQPDLLEFTLTPGGDKQLLSDRLMEAINEINAGVKRGVKVHAATDPNELEKLRDKTLDADDSIADDAGVGTLQQGDFTGRAQLDRGPSQNSYSRPSQIYFFYLGDILETLLETIPIASDIGSKKFAVVLTDFEYLDLFKLLGSVTKGSKGSLQVAARASSFDFSQLKCKESTLSRAQLKKFYSVTNMANIPVEASAFLDFFTDKIVSQNKQNYYLNSFLADMFTSLIKPMLGNSSTLGIPNNQPALINLDVPAVDNTKTVMFMENNKLGINLPRSTSAARIRSRVSIPHASPTEYTYVAEIQDYLNLASPKPGPNADAPFLEQNPDPNQPNNVATVKVLGINNGVGGLEGSYEENIKENIANFVVGLDRGLIKAVKFERVDQPYLRESRVAQDKSFGVGQLRELYHANLTLYGNNILKPGQMIYIEPNRFIFGRPTEESSVSRVLGLGGYHLVVDVSHAISSEGWETSVKALHMSMPTIKP